MERLDFLTQEEMIKFLHCKKTEISCIEEPHTFLNQLRDHDLVPEDLYKKVIKMRNDKRRQKGVYDILDWLEKERGDHIKLFWSCVFKDHIQQKYSILRSLQNSVRDGSFRMDENVPNTEKPSSNKNVEREEKKQEGKNSATKRKKCCEETDEEEPGPSSVTNQKKPKKVTFSPLQDKGELHITCGDKEGILYPDKLARADKCILSQSQWFTPCDFEKFSGKGNSRNWKLSIRCRNTPLLKLIKEGSLQCPRTYRVRRSDGQKTNKHSSSHVESSSPQSASSVETDESSDDNNKESIEEEGRRKEEEEEEEEDSEPEDLSEFQASVLPVICGSVSGDLYRHRFAGARSMSIRTEERWFTPEEFVQQEPTLTDGHWKKDILCHGKTLNYLLKKRILHIHSLLCCCHLCRPKNRLDQYNDDVCYLCNTGGNLVCCDVCPRAFHHRCHLPILDKDTLGEKWTCTCCVLKNRHVLWTHMSREGALCSPVSGNSMRCEYLLLRLFKEDTQRVFTDDPTKTVERYGSVISNPMWLNRIKSKLQKKKYRTVREFVHDVKLIFNNWQTFNRDHNSGRMGAEMKKMFEKEFNTVFKIK